VNIIKETFDAAKKVCEALSSLTSISEINYSHLESLIELLRVSQILWEVGDADVSDKDITNINVNLLPGEKDITFYTSFEPLDKNSTIAVSLKDCINDIYSCVLTGVRSVEKREATIDEIVSWWRSEFHFHIDRHIIDVVRLFVLSGKGNEIGHGLL
jgi:hypothetical protein